MLSPVELEPVPPEWRSLVRTQLEPELEPQRLASLEWLVLVLMGLKLLQLKIQSNQDVLLLQQLYQLRHQLQEEFQQLVKESQYQPCQ
jgi:hypothetical protein